MPEIKFLTIEDIPAAAEIEKMVFSDPWSEKSFEYCINNPLNIYLCAKEENILLGYCGMWCVAGEGQIMNVAVHPNYRRQGIAKQMMKEIISEGKKAGCTAFTLEARVSNLGAIALYESFGFKSAGVRKGYYSHPYEDAVIMWLYI